MICEILKRWNRGIGTRGVQGKFGGIDLHAPRLAFDLARSLRAAKFRRPLPSRQTADESAIIVLSFRCERRDARVMTGVPGQGRRRRREAGRGGADFVGREDDDRRAHARSLRPVKLGAPRILGPARFGMAWWKIRRDGFLNGKGPSARD
jgi:hypothetical protein